MRNTIFVSSTFRDMEYERDLIQQKLVPYLNARMAGTDSEIRFADLRWGVNTGKVSAEEANRRVLTSCLDVIDDCKPHMIIFIGDRYGWVPEDAMIANLARSRGLLLEESRISVTELEIEYGALRDEETVAHSVFCFRTIDTEGMSEADRKIYQPKEDPVYEERLRKLKEKIRSTPGAIIIDYHVSWDSVRRKVTGFEELLQCLEMQFELMFQEQYQEWNSLDSHEQLQRRTRALFENEAHLMDARPQVIRDCEEKLKEEDLVLLRSSDMFERKALLGVLAKKAAQQGVAVFAYADRTGPESYSARFLQQEMIFFAEQNLLRHGVSLPKRGNIASLEEKGSEESKVLAEDRAYLRRLFERSALYGLQALYLLDGLWAGENAVSQLAFLPQRFFETNKVVVSWERKRSLPILGRFHGAGGKVFEIPEISAEEAGSVLRQLLGRENKQLDAAVLQAAVSREGSASSLWMKLLAQRLFMIDGDALLKAADEEAINRHLIQVIAACPDDSTELMEQILQEACRLTDEKQSGEIVKLLAVSEHGLTEDSLKACISLLGMHWNNTEFLRFYQYAKVLFSGREDGVYQLCFVPEKIFDEKNDRRLYHVVLASHFANICRKKRQYTADAFWHSCQCQNASLAFFALRTMLPDTDDMDLRRTAGAVHRSMMEDGGRFLGKVLSCMSDDTAAQLIPFRFLEVYLYDQCTELGSEANRIYTGIYERMAEILEAQCTSVAGNLVRADMMLRAGECCFPQKAMKAMEYFDKMHEVVESIKTQLSPGKYAVYSSMYLMKKGMVYDFWRRMNKSGPGEVEFAHQAEQCFQDAITAVREPEAWNDEKEQETLQTALHAACHHLQELFLEIGDTEKASRYAKLWQIVSEGVAEGTAEDTADVSGEDPEEEQSQSGGEVKNGRTEPRHIRQRNLMTEFRLHQSRREYGAACRSIEEVLEIQEQICREDETEKNVDKLIQYLEEASLAYREVFDFDREIACLKRALDNRVVLYSHAPGLAALQLLAEKAAVFAERSRRNGMQRKVLRDFHSFLYSFEKLAEESEEKEGLEEMQNRLREDALTLAEAAGEESFVSLYREKLGRPMVQEVSPEEAALRKNIRELCEKLITAAESGDYNTIKENLIRLDRLMMTYRKYEDSAESEEDRKEFCRNMTEELEKPVLKCIRSLGLLKRTGEARRFKTLAEHWKQ